MDDNDFFKEYNGLTKDIAKQCTSYFLSTNSLSNSKNEIMEDEKNICFDLFF